VASHDVEMHDQNLLDHLWFSEGMVSQLDDHYVYVSFLFYLDEIQYRYLRSNEESVGEPDWDTPEMVRIKSKKSKRLGQYSESDIVMLKNSLGILFK
jgi:hypothetical protein